MTQAITVQEEGMEDIAIVAEMAVVAHKTQFGRRLTAFEQAAGIDFVQLDTRLSGQLQTTTEQIVGAVKDIEKSVVGQVRRLKLLQTNDFRKVRDVKVDPKPIKDILLNASMYTYFEGKQDALDEVASSLGKKIRFADIGNVKPIESLAKFKKEVPVTKAEFYNMLAQQKQTAFTVAGVMEKQMLTDIQNILHRAMGGTSTSEAWTINDFQNALQKADMRYTGTAYGTDKLKGEPLSPWHTETILRTNFASVYNEGRQMLFDDPAVVDYVPAYQYSAILDQRTRPTHAAMDGKIYPRNDPIWHQWGNPPNGYSCRCLLIPISINMDYTVSNPTNLKPDPGFGGVS